MNRVCFFGIYDPAYSRTKVLKRALEENGYEVVECRVDPREHPGFRKYFELISKFRSLSPYEFECLFVNFPGQSVVWLAKILYRGPVIFDAFLSLYDSNVFDRKLYSKWHPRAWYDWLLDWSGCLMADMVLLDTQEHIKYFERMFGVPGSKCVRVLVGADERVFYPRNSAIGKEPTLVHFHGTFIPLHGIRYIVEAAYLLKDQPIRFRIVGTGLEYLTIRRLAAELELGNIEFVNMVPIDVLAEHVSNSHICLGIFGDSDKTLRVIPNKVYEYAAEGKAIITADSPAIREVFSDGLDVLLCKPENGADLAKAILFLAKNRAQREELGQRARALFTSMLTAKTIGQGLIKKLDELRRNQK